MCELAYLVNSPLSEVIAKCNVYLVGTVHEFLNHLLVGYTEASCRSGKLVELLPRSACVHPFEVLVHLMYFLIRLACVFSHVRHRLFHLGVVIDVLVYGVVSPRHRAERRQSRIIPFVEKVSALIQHGA